MIFHEGLLFGLLIRAQERAVALQNGLRRHTLRRPDIEEVRDEFGHSRQGYFVARSDFGAALHGKDIGDFVQGQESPFIQIVTFKTKRCFLASDALDNIDRRPDGGCAPHNDIPFRVRHDDVPGCLKIPLLQHDMCAIVRFFALPYGASILQDAPCGLLEIELLMLGFCVRVDVVRGKCEKLFPAQPALPFRDIMVRSSPES